MNEAMARLNTTGMVKKRALEKGFDLVRITNADEFVIDREVAIARIAEGMMEGLPWYNHSRVERGTSPRQLLPNARSIICLGLNYFPGDLADQEPDGSTDGQPEKPPAAFAGKVARYARGRDYHRVMKRMMRELVADLSEGQEAPVSARWYVDDGPMLDRAAAARSGLGWFGKNTNILTSELGSWVFLGQIITDLELEPDPPVKKSCGSCVRCIDACPTVCHRRALCHRQRPLHLLPDHREPGPHPRKPEAADAGLGLRLRHLPGGMSRQPKGKPTLEPQFGRGDLTVADLLEILEMTDARFVERFAGHAHHARKASWASAQCLRGPGKPEGKGFGAGPWPWPWQRVKLW